MAPSKAASPAARAALWNEYEKTLPKRDRNRPRTVSLLVRPEHVRRFPELAGRERIKLAARPGSPIVEVLP